MAKCGKGSYAATKFLISVNILDDSTHKLVCSQCAINTICDAEEETIQKFRKFVSNDGVNIAINDIIERFVKYKIISKARMMDQVENKYKVHFTEDIMSISSDMLIQCNSKSDHCQPLSFH